VVNWQRAICLDLFDKVSDVKVRSLQRTLDRVPWALSCEHELTVLRTPGSFRALLSARFLLIADLVSMPLFAFSLQVDVLQYYDSCVRSSKAEFFIPAVLRVRFFIKKKSFANARLSLSRRNILLRDRYQCQ
jgi:hypothetical protein